MDGELGGGGGGDGAQHLVGGEDVGGVVEEVADGDDARLGHAGQLLVGEGALGGQVDVVPRRPHLVLEQPEPFLPLLELVVEEQSLQV